MNIRLALFEIANELDKKGLHKEANILDNLLQNGTFDDSNIETSEPITVNEVLMMPNAAQIIKDARDWAADCHWTDGDMLDEYTPQQILQGVNNHYDGGLNAFLQNTLQVQ